MRIMPATHADTCINALKNIRDLPSGHTSEINMHGRDPSDVSLRFEILLKCQSKFNSLIYDMLYIKEIKPTLNK